MNKYVVWYKTKSGKFTREITFASYNKALSLFNALKRDFKYLIKVLGCGIGKDFNMSLKLIQMESTTLF